MEKFKLNTSAGDGVGIERSVDDGKLWTQVAYVNTGAEGSTATLAKKISIMMNSLATIQEEHCPSLLGLEELIDECSHEECDKCWENAFENATGEEGE